MLKIFSYHFPNVSCETINQIAHYIAILENWNKTHNLIETNEFKSDAFITRHIIDCWQLTEYIEPNQKIVDLGSGNGLPGILLAINGNSVTLVENNKKKIAFLKYVIATLKLQNVKIHTDAFTLSDKFDCVVSRAFRELSILLNLQAKVSHETNFTYGLYLKGKETMNEIMNANCEFLYDYFIYDSLSSKESSIIKITNLIKR